MNKSVLKNATQGLAGAVALAGGSQAYGAVVTVALPANIAANATTPRTSVNFDINGDGITDFIFATAVGSGTSSSGATFAYAIAGMYSASAAYAAFGVDNKTVGYTGSFGTYASRLTAGTTIGPASTFVYSPQYITVLASRFNGANYGALRTRGFVGFQFSAADGLHYGYIELQAAVAGTGSTSAANYTAGLAFFSAAYQTIPNTAITAGAVPEPTSLAALAFGVAGTVGAAAYRRRKAAKTVA